MHAITHEQKLLLRLHIIQVITIEWVYFKGFFEFFKENIFYENIPLQSTTSITTKTIG